LEVEGTISGVPFAYYGHYYSGPVGTIQLIGFTSRKLMNEYRTSIERLVSGFEISR
jgi:hypothetical protein